MHLKNCFGNLCWKNCFGTNRQYEDPHCETINSINSTLSKPTCQIKNQMKRRSPEKSQQRITTQDTILGAIHTPALIPSRTQRWCKARKRCAASNIPGGLNMHSLYSCTLGLNPFFGWWNKNQWSSAISRENQCKENRSYWVNIYCGAESHWKIVMLWNIFDSALSLDRLLILTFYRIDCISILWI